MTTKFQAGKTYRNESMLDTDMHVMSIDGGTLRVAYVLRRNGWMLGKPDDVIIKDEDADKWEEVA